MSIQKYFFPSNSSGKNKNSPEPTKQRQREDKDGEETRARTVLAVCQETQEKKTDESDEAVVTTGTECRERETGVTVNNVVTGEEVNNPSPKVAASLIESECEDDELYSTPKKKCKRLTTFQANWEKEFCWISSVKSNLYKAFCKSCRCEFNITYGGKSAVTNHMKNEKHKNSTWGETASASSSSQPITNFMPVTNSKLEEKVTAAESAHVYHTVLHHHSYNSLDCELKLNKHIYNDSEIASKLSCGKTKAHAIVQGVLGPMSVETTLGCISGEKGIPYGLQTDASNRKNRKMFPLVSQHFTAETGVTQTVLDFVENSDETADEWTQAKRQLKELDYRGEKHLVMNYKKREIFQHVDAQHLQYDGRDFGALAGAFRYSLVTSPSAITPNNDFRCTISSRRLLKMVAVATSLLRNISVIIHFTGVGSFRYIQRLLLPKSAWHRPEMGNKGTDLVHQRQP
ncbi:hypothetical protein B566_EDAN013273 [Ephemera danica]|nr:hypothetical protein B566_EDAN013273 [Ephemera danica]